MKQSVKDLAKPVSMHSKPDRVSEIAKTRFTPNLSEMKPMGICMDT